VTNLEPRPRKGKRSVEWRSPRYYQQMIHRRNPNAQPAKRKHGYCKRAKGPHQWGEEIVKRWHTGEPMYYARICAACGKRKVTRFVPLTEGMMMREIACPA